MSEGEPISAPPSVAALLLQRDLERQLFGESQPVRIGRFTVLELVGRGAMGAVYSAYDPDLDRRIALKVLHSRAARNPEAAARMQREARSLARLSHSAIITVHEVGVHDGRTFIAMDFAEGGTLGHWVRSLEPDNRATEILHRMRECLAGLQAAHEAGLVHRDFKPSNVLVSVGGAAKIADFGLVQVEHVVEPSGLGDEDGEALLVTQSRAMVGTPAYMAAEQFEGHADPLSDQFSLCATFFELFYGHRPFRGDTATALHEAVRTGAIEMPAPEAAPRWILPILVRGLDPDPSRRFGDLRTLRRALDRAAPDRAPRSAWLAGAAAAALVGAAAFWPGADSEAALRLCTDKAAEVESVWGAERRATVRDAFSRTGPPGWSGAVQRVDARMTDWSRAWSESVTASCTATFAVRSQDEAQHERRLECLREQLTRVAEATQGFENPTPDAIYVATRSTFRLPDPEDCNDLLAEDSEERRAALQHLRQALLHDDSRDFDRAHAELRLAIAAAESGSDRALLAAAHIEQARLLTHADRLDEAVVATEAALTAAERASEPTLVWRAWLRRAHALILAGAPEQAGFALERVQSIEQTLPRSEAREGDRLAVEALFELHRGHDVPNALDTVDEAVQSDDVDPEILEVLVDAANVDTSGALARRVIELAEVAYGAESPYVLELRAALSAESGPRDQDALQGALGPSSLSRSLLRARVERLFADGRYADAAELVEALDARPVPEQARGASWARERLLHGRSLMELGHVRPALERFGEALPLLRAHALPGSRAHTAAVLRAGLAHLAAGNRSAAAELFEELVGAPTGRYEDPEIRSFVATWLEHDRSP